MKKDRKPFQAANLLVSLGWVPVVASSFNYQPKICNAYFRSCKRRKKENEKDTCNAPNAHVSLLINTVHILLIIPLLRTNKLDGWGATAILKDKALRKNTKYNITNNSS